MSSLKWLPLESNPEVMNKSLRSFGVPKNLGVTDILSLDEEFIPMIPVPCLAIMLLFPVTEKYEDYCETVELRIKSQGEHPGIYFMKQTIRNACGTIALIHALANNEQHLNLQPGSVLRNFLDSTKNLSPEDKGKVLEENMDISAVHEEVAQEGQTEAPSSDEEFNLHFISFVRVGDKLVELDGRKSGPVIHGTTNKESFVRDACRACQEYMKRDPDNLTFNAMAFGATD